MEVPALPFGRCCAAPRCAVCCVLWCVHVCAWRRCAVCLWRVVYMMCVYLGAPHLVVVFVRAGGPSPALQTPRSEGENPAVNQPGTNRPLPGLPPTARPGSGGGACCRPSVLSMCSDCSGTGEIGPGQKPRPLSPCLDVSTCVQCGSSPTSASAPIWAFLFRLGSGTTRRSSRTPPLPRPPLRRR